MQRGKNTSLRVWSKSRCHRQSITVNFTYNSVHCYWFTEVTMHWKLENVATANGLQLKAARAMPVLSRCNYEFLLLRCHAKFEGAQLIHCSGIAFLLMIHYFSLWNRPLTPWPWPLTFGLLEHCSVSLSPVMWTRCSAISERPRCRVCHSFRQK